MSDTPKLADESKKLLDAGWHLGMFRNGLGSYTAYVFRGEQPPPDFNDEDAVEDFPENHLTDDFEPSQALYRLTEKVFGNIV